MQDKRINKRRLLLVGDNVTDPKSWSGTPFAIYSELQKQEDILVGDEQSKSVCKKCYKVFAAWLTKHKEQQ